jgi:predicted metal-dependent phosphoesterase TrpH/glycosyltransferase involved in cell wall biosynthesis
MARSVALVTPFAWSQPHDVNEHVDGLARALRARGHHVTVLAPSNRARDLAAGRRALARGESPDSIAIGPALPRIGVPVGVRANLAVALAEGRFDVVHGFEPGLPSISYLALRDAPALTVATFLSPERLTYPPARSRRERLLGRLDALLASSSEIAAAAAERFPGSYELVPLGVDLELFAPVAKRNVVVLEWRQAERPLLRALARELEPHPDWELVVLRARPLGGRPPLPRALRGRVHVRTALDGRSRAELLREAAVFVPATEGTPRVLLEARAAGAAVVDPPSGALPELVAAETARLAEDERFRTRRAAEGRKLAERDSFEALATRVESVYSAVTERRRVPTRRPPLEDRDWIVADLHMHTNWSHDCSIDVDELLAHAESEGLGAIAITDHNVFGGALEAIEAARTRKLVVIPGEEIKTGADGEVIGLFLQEEIPRGLTFGETVAAIRAQGGLVYVPHPFDRLHSIPSSATLQRHLAEIDVFEVYNARLLFEAYNDEAVRFARKYNLTAAAGSDAHVLQGVGTGAVRMRRFEGPEEFLLALRTAEILRRPKSLAYLQGLKWVAQAKERVR